MAATVPVSSPPSSSSSAAAAAAAAVALAAVGRSRTYVPPTPPRGPEVVPSAAAAAAVRVNPTVAADVATDPRATRPNVPQRAQVERKPSSSPSPRAAKPAPSGTAAVRAATAVAIAGGAAPAAASAAAAAAAGNDDDDEDDDDDGDDDDDERAVTDEDAGARGDHHDDGNADDAGVGDSSLHTPTPPPSPPAVRLVRGTRAWMDRQNMLSRYRNACKRFSARTGRPLGYLLARRKKRSASEGAGVETRSGARKNARVDTDDGRRRSETGGDSDDDVAVRGRANGTQTKTKKTSKQTASQQQQPPPPPSQQQQQQQPTADGAEEASLARVTRRTATADAEVSPVAPPQPPVSAATAAVQSQQPPPQPQQQQQQQQQQPQQQQPSQLPRPPQLAPQPLLVTACPAGAHGPAHSACVPMPPSPYEAMIVVSEQMVAEHGVALSALLQGTDDAPAAAWRSRYDSVIGAATLAASEYEERRAAGIAVPAGASLVRMTFFMLAFHHAWSVVADRDAVVAMVRKEMRAGRIPATQRLVREAPEAAWRSMDTMLTAYQRSGTAALPFYTAAHMPPFSAAFLERVSRVMAMDRALEVALCKFKFAKRVAAPAAAAPAASGATQ